MTTIDVTGLPEPVIRDIRRLVDTLRSRLVGPQPTGEEGQRKLLRGCLAGRGLTIPTLQDIDDVRREMGSNFPRDLPARAE
jgi:hypothetical protein